MRLPELLAMALVEELDELIRIGEKLVPQGGGILMGPNMIRLAEYTAWRLRCLSAIQAMGGSGRHLIPLVNRPDGDTRFLKQNAHEVLGAVAAARIIAGKVVAQTETQKRSPHAERSVFLVHGHNHAALHETARLLKELDLNPVILFEEPAKGRTIIEKLEQRSLTDAAVVLLTPDDVGAPAGDQSTLRPRARQNVLLELGYFLGLLGRQKVVVLYAEGVELPSDYVGVEYIKLDSAGAWRLQVARELRAAGLQIDLNRL